ncbi:MAG: hydantoinase B/oxoprolinase family protein [Chloroflexi bacterium]|nr:hydantoinase B/oxoprolinase family protein [Chloroflexota bacterium]
MTNQKPLADRVSVSVFQRRLKSIASEMSYILLKATRSPLANQARDFGTALMDARGGMLEQDEFRALFAFAVPWGCKAVVDFFGDDVHPGDVIYHNDVFSGNLQLSDAGAYVPIFHGDKLIAWSGCKGHQLDIGGPVASSTNPEATELYQEGLRIPPVKLYEKGVFRRDVWNLIFSNIRMRDLVEPDVRAQIGACTVGQRRVQALVEAHGPDKFLALVDELYASTELRMREEIREIPDGAYAGESFVHAVAEDTIYRIKLTVTVEGDQMTFDYTGTDPQARGYTNAPFASAYAATLTVLSMLVDPDMPHNEGMLRAVTVQFPKGSILNPQMPAATYYGNFMSAMNGEAIMLALSQALPDRVTAGWARPMSLQFTGFDPRRNQPFGDIIFLSFKGGGGATQGLDGWDNVGPIFSVSTTVQDYEFFELQDPFFLIEHEFEPDSAGAGEWRGGMGNKTRWRYYGSDGVGVLQGEPEGGYGLFGGKASYGNIFEYTLPDGSVHRCRPQEIVKQLLPPGTIFEQHSGGGGGYGAPWRRPIEKVVADVRNGVVSPQKAASIYGVVVEPTSLQLDLAETERRRAWLAKTDKGGDPWATA